jgi:glutamate-1-semialdehyde aminotransferase
MDEVQTGFGRMGSHYWGFEAHGTTPDIVVLGKGMGNGFPISGVIVRREIAEESVAYHWITADGEKIGFLATGPISAGGPCSLHKCYLLPERQRSGHGSAALELLASLV